MKKIKYYLLTIIFIISVISLRIITGSLAAPVDNNVVEKKEDNILSYIINDELYPAPPTTSHYSGTVVCTDEDATGTVTWNGTSWNVSVTNITEGNAKCDVIFDSLYPDGWDNPESGTLMAGIKANNPTLSTPVTTPGESPSATGTITSSVEDFCFNLYEDDCYLSVYSSYNDLKNGQSSSAGDYPDIYSNLSNKWVYLSSLGDAYYIYNATATTVTYTNDPNITTPESVMLSAKDDYGMSYYYRGSIDNNYVSFAGMCWRIVRITGNGAIKLVLYNYNPTGASNPCDASLDSQRAAFPVYNDNFGIERYGTSQYNLYVGDNALFATDGGTSDSNILADLKTWYNNVFSSSQKNKLADVIWCNNQKESSRGVNYANNEVVYFASYKHINDGPLILKCGTNKNDNKISKFTANDTIYGNGALNGYKIGLLTAEEAVFAGAYKGSSNYYLKQNAYGVWWSISINYLVDNELWFVYRIYYNGLMDGAFPSDTQDFRPAIALKSDTTISGGVGTQASPFVVN